MKNNYAPSVIKVKTVLSFMLIVVCTAFAFSQTEVSSNTDLNFNRDICKYQPVVNPQKSSIKPADNVQSKMSRGDNCSTFIVTYNGFTPEAEAAFQFAVDIWSNSIASDVPIRVSANFSPLGANVLGSAGAAGFLINISGFPSNVAFANALGEQLIGEDSDGPDGVSNDINANFSSTANFYFGTDANPPANQIDFVTVVLHELGHGLGLFGFGRVPTDMDGVPDPDPPVVGELRNQGFISRWDQFIENDIPDVMTSFADPSEALLDEYTGNNLFCNGPSTTAQNGGTKPSMHAPSNFIVGSSYSHWDENTYPFGDPNSLMTPSVGFGEAIHDPGVVTLGFMQDMGWAICGNVLSTENFDLGTILIRPNPFNELITIQLETQTNDALTVNILDINGRVVFETTAVTHNGTATISNLNQLEDTLYFIKIINQSSGASITKKIIKN